MKMLDHLLMKGGRTLYTSLVRGGIFLFGVLAVLALVEGFTVHARMLVGLWLFGNVLVFAWIVIRQKYESASIGETREDFFMAPGYIEGCLLVLSILVGVVGVSLANIPVTNEDAFIWALAMIGVGLLLWAVCLGVCMMIFLIFHCDDDKSATARGLDGYPMWTAFDRHFPLWEVPIFYSQSYAVDGAGRRGMLRMVVLLRHFCHFWRRYARFTPRSVDPILRCRHWTRNVCLCVGTFCLL